MKRGWKRVSIQEAYVDINNLSGKCRILSDLVGIYVLNPGEEGGTNGA